MYASLSARDWKVVVSSILRSSDSRQGSSKCGPASAASGRLKERSPKVPPPCNTGVPERFCAQGYPLPLAYGECRPEGREVTMVWDGISATFRGTGHPDYIMAMVSKGATWEDTKRGWRNYDHCWKWGEIRCAYGGQEGIHVAVGGSGCRQLEAISGFDWRSGLNRWLADGASFTVAHAAFDEHCGLIDIGVVHACVKSGAFLSASRKWEHYESNEDGGGERIGETVYVGSVSAALRSCFYNKAVEQGVDGHWSRAELRGRDEWANLMVRAFLDGGSVGMAELFLRHVEFKVLTGLVHKNEEKTCEWWAEFVGYCCKAKIELPKHQTSLYALARHLDEQYGAALATLEIGLPDFRAWLSGVLVGGRQRMGSKHLAMLDAEGVDRRSYGARNADWSVSWDVASTAGEG